MTSRFHIMEQISQNQRRRIGTHTASSGAKLLFMVAGLLNYENGHVGVFGTARNCAKFHCHIS